MLFNVRLVDTSAVPNVRRMGNSSHHSTLLELTRLIILRISPTSAEGSVPRRRQLQPLRVRVRWTCHECQKTFKDLETKCSKCGHAKCDSCTRDPAVEEKPPEDPEALRSAGERLKNLEVSPQATAA